jgi:S1-C subfamily serine protease
MQHTKYKISKIIVPMLLIVILALVLVGCDNLGVNENVGSNNDAGLNSSDTTEPKCNHNYSDWTVNKQPSCTSIGTKSRICSRCSYVDEVAVPAIDHDYQWVVKYQATTATEGLKEYKCSVCSKVINTEVIPKEALSQSQIEQKLNRSVLKVYVYDYDKTTLLSQGSGFFINNMGDFVTNAHVVDGAYFIEVKTYIGGTYEVDKIYSFNDINTDLAVCHAKNAFATPVEFATNATAGETVYALGYPNDSFTLRTSKGVLTAESVSAGGITYYENTADIDHGSSGGVLVNGEGKVIGITTCSFNGGSFGAIRYRDVKYSIDGGHFGTQTPLEYFHYVNEVNISMINASMYFDVIVNPVAGYSGDSVTYYVTIQLKDYYRNKKFYIDSTSLSIEVEIDTTYTYYKNGYRHTDVDYFGDDTIYIYNEYSLLLGPSTTIRSNSYVYGAEYTNITYDVDFGLCSGTIVFID